ncbi:MAG: hypothetical protein AB8B91_22780 [Rubripirellula sp.]
MSLAKRFSALLICFSTLWFTGCVSPMGCGPGGNCGPLALNNSCDGCGDCEGCGELYIDPWVNHPADACDPCDKCGNFNGQSCGKCRSVFDGLASMWGYRCDGGCDSGCDTGCAGGCDGGCDSGCGSCGLGGGRGALNACASGCGGCDSCCTDSCGGCDSCGGGGGLVQIQSEPTMAHDIVEATESYQPNRTRKIFNPKTRVSAKQAHSGMRHAQDSGKAITFTR